MMQKDKLPTTPELLGVDAALRRAAVNAKKLAEQQGVPFITKDSIGRVGNTLPAPPNSSRGQ